MLHIYTLSHDRSPESYDESLVVASLQGIINRDNPELYVLSNRDTRPQYWLEIFSAEGQWLSGRKHQEADTLDSLVEIAGSRLKGAVIWDPEVPATVNVATTVAGVRNAVVLSPEFADKYLKQWSLPVVEDLRGRFTGRETGSRKNDAYRWAIGEYLAKGLCSSHLLCLFEDSFFTRHRGGTDYVVTRDWTVMNRAFTFDLSPWADEAPEDDLDQPVGTDFETYTMILQEVLRQARGEQMTEVVGFFCGRKYTSARGRKSRHAPVPTEWETVRLISAYNCYQNTISRDCYNQSLHSKAPFVPLKQQRPASKPSLENKSYICFLMADYDSTTPLYSYLPDHWSDPNRGKMPLSWGINPNLIEMYPDVISYFYATATDNDYFVSDASAAGYMNPNSIRSEYMPLFIKHNKHFFSQTDMTVAPMVLDWAEPTPEVKDAFAEFAPDGIAVLVHDFRADNVGRSPKPHVWKGMPVTELLDGTHKFREPEKTAEVIYRYIRRRTQDSPGFYYFRRVWSSPSYVLDTIAALRQQYPELEFEVVDPYTFFALFREYYEKHADIR